MPCSSVPAPTPRDSRQLFRPAEDPSRVDLLNLMIPFPAPVDATRAACLTVCNSEAAMAPALGLGRSLASVLCYSADTNPNWNGGVQQFALTPAPEFGEQLCGWEDSGRGGVGQVGQGGG